MEYLLLIIGLTYNKNFANDHHIIAIFQIKCHNYGIQIFLCIPFLPFKFLYIKEA